MVSCEPYHSYKVPLKNNGQSIIEHNLVTIYFSLEWPNNINDNPNLLVHIFDKKTAPKTCKIEPSMSYIQQNQSSLFVNSINHHQPPQQQLHQNFGSTYQQQYNNHSSVINNDQPTKTGLTNGDHNDVSSTTTTVVFSGIQPQQISSISHPPLQQVKTELQTQLSPVYQRQQTPSSPSSSSQQYLSSQHVIQTPSSNIDTQSNLQMSPIPKTISPTSSTTIPTKQTMTHVIDLQQSSSLSSYPLSTASTFKAITCNCSKTNIAHDNNCPALALIKYQSNTNLNTQTIICRPSINRSIAQRAAVASQIRANRAISMAPTKDPGQTPPATVLQFSISNTKPSDLASNISMITSQQQQQSNFPTIKKPIVRQRSIGSTNSRQKKKRIIKQVSLPNGSNQDQASTAAFFNQFSLNDSKPEQSSFMIKEEHISSSNPTIKLVSPFSIQTTVSNTDIDQTIDDVINGKGDIRLDDSSPIQTKREQHQQQQQQQQQQQPSSQLVWVQNGTVTTKTWLSPLYHKQQQQHQQHQP
ncbi:unnamed protein product, partial [Rotaria socialis]